MSRELYSVSHCPYCGYWVPSRYMNYDFDGSPNGMGLIRMCSNCLEGTEVFSTKRLQYDPNFGKVQCIYCDSYNTEPLGGEKDAWKCRDCGEISYVLS